MRNKSIISYWSLALAAISFLAVAAFLPPTIASAQAKRTIKIGYVPISSLLPLYVGLGKGYFADEGIEIKLKIVGFRHMVAAVVSGDIDLAAGRAAFNVLVARAQGLNLKIVAAYFVRTSPPGNDTLLVRKDSGINSPKDLAGKTIGIVALRSVSEVMTSEVLRKAGVDLRTVQWIEVPVAHMAKALTTKQVDAVQTFEPFVTILKQSGKAKILSYVDLETIPGHPIATYAVLERWLRKNRDLTDRFRRAYDRGVAYIKSSEDSARQMLPKYTRLKAGLAQKITLPDFGGSITVKQLERLQTLAFKYKMIKRRINVRDLLY